MSKAEDLLETLSNDSIDRVTVEEEPHIIIGDDRYITVPDQLKRLAVQYDHDIETVTFECPRYWDEHDMSTMAIYINYLCPDRSTGAYLATNIKTTDVADNIMQFDWTISKNITMKDGKLTFLVCIKNVDDEGNEKNHWNSELCTDCYVSKGLEFNAEMYEDVWPDIIEQWHKQVLNLTDSLIQARDNGEFDGATFTPQVNSSTGVISWHNNKGKTNPTPVNIKGPAGVSPSIQIEDIQGGHKVIITDADGSKSFDVMDTIIDSSDAVNELLNRFVTISNSQPTVGPSLWFDPTTLNTNEYEAKYVDTNGTVKNLNFSSVDLPYFAFTDDGVIYKVNIPSSMQLRLSDNISFTIITDQTSTDSHPMLTVNDDTTEYEIVRRGYSKTSDLETSPGQDEYGEWNNGWLVAGYPVRVTFCASASCFIADFPVDPRLLPLDSSQYGLSLPTAGIKGRIFYKKLQ